MRRASSSPWSGARAIGGGDVPSMNPCGNKKERSRSGPLSMFLFIRSTKSYENFQGAYYPIVAPNARKKRRPSRRPTPGLGSRRRQFIILEGLAQLQLVDLAGRVCEFPSPAACRRHPPFGDMALQVTENLVGARRRALLGTTTSSGRSSHLDGRRDHRRLATSGCRRRDSRFDRGNPFAARLDDVFRAVGICM